MLRPRNYRHYLGFDLLLLAVVFLCLGLASLSAIAAEPTPLRAWAALHGKSMVPTFPDNCLIEIDIGVPGSALQSGKIVIFRSPDPSIPFKCHRLVVKRGGAWITKGDGNANYDTEWTKDSDVFAVATGRYTLILLAPMDVPPIDEPPRVVPIAKANVLAPLEQAPNQHPAKGPAIR